MDRTFAYSDDDGWGHLTCYKLQFLSRVTLRVELWVAAVPNLADEAGRQRYQVTTDEDTGATFQGHGLWLLLY